jgi:hypothetical protein
MVIGRLHAQRVGVESIRVPERAVRGSAVLHLARAAGAVDEPVGPGGRVAAWRRRGAGHDVHRHNASRQRSRVRTEDRETLRVERHNRHQARRHRRLQIVTAAVCGRGHSVGRERAVRSAGDVDRHTGQRRGAISAEDRAGHGSGSGNPDVNRHRLLIGHQDAGHGPTDLGFAGAWHANSTVMAWPTCASCNDPLASVSGHLSYPRGAPSLVITTTLDAAGSPALSRMIPVTVPRA